MPDPILPPLTPTGAQASAPRRLTRSTLVLLIGLQLLLALTVAAGVWAVSSHLRHLMLQDMLSHARVQTHNLEDRLSQSFQLLQMHLQALTVEPPALESTQQHLQAELVALQRKLPYIRSLSVLDAQGRIVASTQEANLGRSLQLEPLLPQMAEGTAGVLRFGHPWRGRDFADGSPWPRTQQDQPVTDTGFFPVVLVLPDAPQWALVAAINSDYFINLAPGRQVEATPLQYSIYLDDGTLLFSSAPDEQPGVVLPQAQRLAQVLEHKVGTAQWPMLDGGGGGRGDVQLAAFRVSRSHPWFVLSQASSRDVLLPWQGQVRNLALGALTLVAVLLLVTGALTRRVQRTLAREEHYMEQISLAASVFLHTSDLIAITDAQGQVVAVNPAFERGMGFEAQEVLGRRVGEWAPGRAAPTAFAELWATLGSRSTWQGEVQERRKDGSVLTGLLAVNAVRDHEGRVVNYVGVLRDLSRLHADAATIRKLSLAVEQSPTSIVITSTAPAIEYANPQFYRSTGYTPQEVLGVNPNVLRSGQTPAATYEAMWAALRAGQVWRGEFVNRRKDGSLYAESAIVAPLIDAAGRTTHYLGIKQDITAQKETEKALRLAASVVAQTHDGVMVCDAQLRIIDVNPAFTRITGYSAEQVLGRKPCFLSAGSKNGECYPAVWEALQAKGYWQGEFWNRRSDGSTYVAASTLNAVCDEHGQVTHYVSVFSDATQRKHQEQYLEQLAHFDPLTRLPNRALLADRLAQAMARTVREPIVLSNGHTVQVGGSMGISLHPRDGLDGDTLLRYADQAMYQAKQGGRNRWVFYNPEMADTPSSARLIEPQAPQ